MVLSLLIVSIATNIALFIIVILLSKNIVRLANFKSAQLGNAWNMLPKIVKRHHLHRDRYVGRFFLDFKEYDFLKEFLEDRKELKVDHLPEKLKEDIIKCISNKIANNLTDNKKVIRLYLERATYQYKLNFSLSYTCMSHDRSYYLELRESLDKIKDLTPKCYQNG
ncbi:hypothetical protein GCM10009120_44190 [Sphingobacterium siyangense subsp. cladoniae]|uniref:hypothetical protein n=1 Tax=Sphingobacterium siyangense TaxID=459529 RepID=UPI0031F8CE3B